jgi:hypothetical protein
MSNTGVDAYHGSERLCTASRNSSSNDNTNNDNTNNANKVKSGSNVSSYERYCSGLSMVLWRS